eukprot:scaffold51165_cov32-Tisochrysis_lutea.AAC.9
MENALRIGIGYRFTTLVPRKGSRTIGYTLNSAHVQSIPREEAQNQGRSRTQELSQCPGLYNENENGTSVMVMGTNLVLVARALGMEESLA